MTASASQPRARRRERRIIERPRLIKMLDESDARVILLLAPAGYGKTTLARQWAKPLQRHLWITLTPGHRDVASLATEIVRLLDADGGQASPIIRQHLNAKSNPQRAARELGEVVNELLASGRVQWVIFDDYEAIGSSEAEDFIATIEARGAVRILAASRVRPSWATGRSVVYGEVTEIGRDELAMTSDETALVIERRPDVLGIAKQAAGWPAAVGLAANVPDAELPSDALPSALHRYLAEELFNRAPHPLRDALIEFALLGDASDKGLRARFGARTESLFFRSD